MKRFTSACFCMVLPLLLASCKAEQCAGLTTSPTTRISCSSLSSTSIHQVQLCSDGGAVTCFSSGVAVLVKLYKSGTSLLEYCDEYLTSVPHCNSTHCSFPVGMFCSHTDYPGSNCQPKDSYNRPTDSVVININRKCPNEVGIKTTTTYNNPRTPKPTPASPGDGGDTSTKEDGNTSTILIVACLVLIVLVLVVIIVAIYIFKKRKKKASSASETPDERPNSGDFFYDTVITPADAPIGAMSRSTYVNVTVPTKQGK